MIWTAGCFYRWVCDICCMWLLCGQCLRDCLLSWCAVARSDDLLNVEEHMGTLYYYYYYYCCCNLLLATVNKWLLQRSRALFRAGLVKWPPSVPTLSCSQRREWNPDCLVHSIVTVPAEISWSCALRCSLKVIARLIHVRTYICKPTHTDDTKPCKS